MLNTIRYLRELDMPLAEIEDFLKNKDIGLIEEKLLRYIDRHKMQIDGFSREVTLIDYGITNDTDKFVTEICIPVKCE